METEVCFKRSLPSITAGNSLFGNLANNYTSVVKDVSTLVTSGAESRKRCKQEDVKEGATGQREVLWLSAELCGFTVG